MVTFSKLQLEKLYELASSATASTNFYNQVYKYIGYINQSPFLTHILDEDDKEMHIYDLEKQQTRPKQMEGESWHTYFLKTMRHMNSGEHNFVSHLFFLLNHNIFDLLDWHYTENYQSDAVTVMLHGKIKMNHVDRWLRGLHKEAIISFDDTDYNEKYITHFPSWKSILTNFHIKLVKKIDQTKSQTIPVSQGEVILELHNDGYFRYLTNEGTINPKLKEYQLLHMLIVSGKNPINYGDIADNLFKKGDTPSRRRDIQQIIKKLKSKLGIKTSNRHKLIESSQNYGYYLALKGDERAITKP